MADFPPLKTGAFAQYPSDRTRGFSTKVYQFLDGSEQRFAYSAGPLGRWQIRLDLLDESELETLCQFFVSQQGRSGSFAFHDPFDGTVFPNCSFDTDTLALSFQGPQKGVTSVGIKENR